MRPNWKNIARGITTISVLVLFALYTLSAQVSFPDLVVCLGSDGHMALESQESWFHCEMSLEVSHKSLVGLLEKHPAYSSDCLDIPLYQNAGYQFILAKNKLFLNGIQQVVLYPILMNARSTPTVCCEHPSDHIANPIIQTVETTVLLI
ncbi:MAG: hypothetical protein GXO78_12365 [Calditrichaeota bacterium]|nr:hypothetical protein [Calditrichota bacterium]